MLFIKNGIYHILERDIGESIDQFYERGYFIIDMLNKLDKEKSKYSKTEKLNQAIKFSRIFINIKYKHCLYSEEIMEKMKCFIN
jgi:hypothetical protein